MVELVIVCLAQTAFNIVLTIRLNDLKTCEYLLLSKFELNSLKILFLYSLLVGSKKNPISL